MRKPGLQCQRTLVGLLASAAFLVACAGGGRQAPVAGVPRGQVPDLAGSTVLLYPVQLRSAIPGDVDAELAFALDGSGSRANWVKPDALRRRMEQSPGTPLQVDGLPVEQFLAGEVLRIGDPLFGFLRRAAALDDASYALIPIAARSRAATSVSAAGVEVVAALLDAQSGRVVWQATVFGEGALEDPATLARAAQRLAAWF